MAHHLETARPKTPRTGPPKPEQAARSETIRSEAYNCIRGDDQTRRSAQVLGADSLHRLSGARTSIGRLDRQPGQRLSGGPGDIDAEPNFPRRKPSPWSRC